MGQRHAVAVALAGLILACGEARGQGVDPRAEDPGVCRGLDPACFRGPKPAAAPRLLLVTRTDGFRHANLGPSLASGLNPPLAAGNLVQKGMLDLAQANGWRLDYTEDLVAMHRLDGYGAVIFFSTTGGLDDQARAALARHLRAGGGFVGVHNAVAAVEGWPWYAGLLGGAALRSHGPHRLGEVIVVDGGIWETPRRFTFRDEWYDLAPLPAGVRVLATAQGGARPPVAWCQYYDGGRSWVTTLGHDDGLFSSDDQLPGAARFRSLIVDGIRSVTGAEPFCR